MAPQIKIKVLKNLQRFENVSLVFRNQLFSFKSWWAFASFSLTLEIVLSVNALGKYFDLGVAWSAEVYLLVFFDASVCINSIVLTYVACSSTSYYRLMASHFNELNSYFYTNSKYRVNIKKLNTYICLLFLFMYLYILGTFYPLLSANMIITNSWTVVNQIYLSYVSCRFATQIAMFMTYVSVISEFARNISAVMTSVYEKLQNGIYLASQDAEEAEGQELFFKLPLVYYKLNEIFELFLKNFGFQIFITLGAIVIFFVLMAYVAITYEDWTTFAFATFFILLYGAITIVLAATSQKVIKSLDAAYVMMTRINFTLVAGDKHSRYVKSLLRVSALRSRGGGLRCSGGLRLGMPLVPAMLSVSAAYTIVVMQFSNAVWNLRL